MSDPSLTNEQFNAMIRNRKKAANPDVIEFEVHALLATRIRAALPQGRTMAGRCACVEVDAGGSVAFERKNCAVHPYD